MSLSCEPSDHWSAEPVVIQTLFTFFSRRAAFLARNRATLCNNEGMSVRCIISDRMAAIMLASPRLPQTIDLPGIYTVNVQPHTVAKHTCTNRSLSHLPGCGNPSRQKTQHSAVTASSWLHTLTKSKQTND